MIYIVIPVFNRLNFTINCLNSLVRQNYKDYKIIVVNDGSTDDTAKYLETNYPDVLQLHGNGDLWWAGSTNLGVQKALQLSGSGNDYILTLNNDLEVKEDYLQSLLNVAVKNPNSLVGSVSVDINAPDKIHFAGTRWNSKTAKYRGAVSENICYKEIASLQDTIATDLLPGRGVLIPITVFIKIGVYDFSTFPHYMADEDFSLRAKKVNYELLIATKAVVYNHVDATGLQKRKHDLKYYKDVFTSVKSPVNTHYRWNWAKRHATIFPPLYFMADTLRIIKSLLFK